VIRTTFIWTTTMTTLAIVFGTVLAPLFAGRTVEMYVAGFLTATGLQFAAGARLWRGLRRATRDV
jgi:hypothetical protein